MDATIILLAWLWAFWAIYIMVMGIYRAHLSRRLAGINLVLGMPIVVLGYVMDAISNIAIATLLFADLPREWLVTTRLQRYIVDDDGWRRHIALYICDNLLDPFDPTGNHC